MTLIIGDQAPDFELVNQFGENVKLSDFRGKKNVVIVFYPLSFSGICTGELCELRDNFAAFEDASVELLAISVDSNQICPSHTILPVLGLFNPAMVRSAVVFPLPDGPTKACNSPGLHSSFSCNGVGIFWESEMLSIIFSDALYWSGCHDG